jgi:hypothetical protein
MATVEVERGSVLMPAESPDQERVLHRGKKTAMKNAPPMYKLPKRVLHRGESLAQRRYHRVVNTRENAPQRKITEPKKAP